MTLVILLSALVQAGIEHVSVVLFGSKVRVVKVASMAWDPVAMLLLLHNLDFDAAVGSNDAAGIHVALDVLADASARGPKKVFVLTDGYSSCGLDLVSALVRAEEERVDVLGLCVGMEPSVVSKMYKRWMTVAVPSALPDAFRAFYEQESVGTSASAVGGDGDDWLKRRLQTAGAVCGGGGAFLRHLRTPLAVFGLVVGGSGGFPQCPPLPPLHVTGNVLPL